MTNDPLLDAFRRAEQKLTGELYSVLGGVPSSRQEGKLLRTPEAIQAEIDELIADAEYEALPEFARDSLVGRGFYQATKEEVAERTDPKNMTLVGRSIGEAMRVTAATSRWALRTKAAREFYMPIDRLLGLPEGFIRDAADGVMSGYIDGVAPAESYLGKVAQGVGQNTVTIGGAIAGSAAVGSVAGPVGTVAGGLAGFVGAMAATYPYAEAMAENQYRTELLRRNL